MDQGLTLTGARIALSATKSARIDLYVRGGRVYLHKAKGAGRQIDLTGFLVLPGLVNAHDHLELNLLPRLGRGPYPNANAWAKDIYRPDVSPLSEHLSLPKYLRLLWGGIKNLISGVTTVAHHNEGHPILFTRDFPVRVLNRFGWAHSLRFSPDWKERFRRSPAGAPFIIHAGEGVDAESSQEIHELHRSAALTPSTVLVHGVALGSTELSIVEDSGSSLIICPSSNLFTLGRTVPRALLTSRIPISLGTDSALTAKGDLIDELEVASALVDAKRLFNMVTTAPARMLYLSSGTGRIQHKGPADLLVVRDMGQTPSEALLNLCPEMVLVRGRINLVSERLSTSIPLCELAKYQTITIEQRGRWLMPFSVSSLIAETERIVGSPIRLAGRTVSA